MATKTFEAYFASKGQLPGEELIAGDEILVLRGGTVFRGAVSINTALASMLDNAGVTTINTVDVWESINGTLTDDFSTATFTYAANQYTYIGANQLSPDIIRASFSISKAGNTFKTYEVGIFVNAVQVGTGMKCSSQSDEPAFAACIATHILQTGDVVDMRIRGRTDDTDVTVIDAQLGIGK